MIIYFIEKQIQSFIATEHVLLNIVNSMCLSVKKDIFD